MDFLRIERDEQRGSQVSTFFDTPSVRVEKHSVDGVEQTLHFSAEGELVQIDIPIDHEGFQTQASSAPDGLISDAFGDAIVSRIAWEFHPAGEGPVIQGVKEVPASCYLASQAVLSGVTSFTSQFLLGDDKLLSLSYSSPPTAIPPTFMLAASCESGRGIWHEFFDRDRSGMFRKRRDSGEVQCHLHESDGRKQIARMEFLTNAALRCLINPMSATGRRYDRLVIMQGSVLSWPVIADGRFGFL